MQADAKCAANRSIRRLIAPRTFIADHQAGIDFRPSVDAVTRVSFLPPISFLSALRHLPIIKGWAMKAFEFINSGPPALLNNPCCCRRVVCFSFLKHAMEVHYG